MCRFIGGDRRGKFNERVLRRASILVCAKNIRYQRIKGTTLDENPPPPD
jgi:hypothetical protein